MPALGVDVQADAHRQVALVAQDVQALGGRQHGDALDRFVLGQADEEVQAERFREVRLALNQLSERLLNLDSDFTPPLLR